MVLGVIFLSWGKNDFFLRMFRFENWIILFDLRDWLLLLIMIQIIAESKCARMHYSISIFNVH